MFPRVEGYQERRLLAFSCVMMIKHMRRSSKKSSPRRETEWYIRIGVLLLTVVILLAIVGHKKDFYQFENLGYVGLFLLNVLSNATVLIPLPSIIAVFIGGALWNPFLVGVISGIGNAVGELVGFFLGYGGRGILNHLDGNQKTWLEKVETWFRRSGFITIFITSAIPLPFFDIVGIVSGTLNYPVWKFFIATAMGRILRNIILAWSGARIIP